MVKNPSVLLSAVVVIVMALAGCSLDNASPSARSVPSPVPPTATVHPRPTRRPTSTPWAPTRQPTRVTPTVRPSPTNVPNCRYDAAFVRDVTIPDGTIMGPDEAHSKAWELRNTGTCHWHGDVRLTPVHDGTRMHAFGHAVVPPTRAGETAKIVHRMVSPEESGDYIARFQLCVDRHCFGPVFWTSITVRGGSASTRPPTPVPSINGWTGFTCDRCIKGNISYRTGERIYHIPGCDYYEATVINTRYGERWFSSEAEAVLAGWRKALNCP